MVECFLSDVSFGEPDNRTNLTTITKMESSEPTAEYPTDTNHRSPIMSSDLPSTGSQEGSTKRKFEQDELTHESPKLAKYFSFNQPLMTQDNGLEVLRGGGLESTIIEVNGTPNSARSLTTNAIASDEVPHISSIAVAAEMSSVPLDHVCEALEAVYCDLPKDTDTEESKLEGSDPLTSEVEAQAIEEDLEQELDHDPSLPDEHTTPTRNMYMPSPAFKVPVSPEEFKQQDSDSEPDDEFNYEGGFSQNIVGTEYLALYNAPPSVSRNSQSQSIAPYALTTLLRQIETLSSSALQMNNQLNEKYERAKTTFESQLESVTQENITLQNLVVEKSDQIDELTLPANDNQNTRAELKALDFAYQTYKYDSFEELLTMSTEIAVKSALNDLAFEELVINFDLECNERIMHGVAARLALRSSSNY
jgi:hypothetical protein